MLVVVIIEVLYGKYLSIYLVILGSEQPGGGVRIDDQGGEGGLRDANYTKSYSTRKISGKPPKNQKTPKKLRNPPPKKNQENPSKTQENPPNPQKLAKNLLFRLWRPKSRGGSLLVNRGGSVIASYSTKLMYFLRKEGELVLSSC